MGLIVLIIVLLFVFGGGGYAWGGAERGPYYGGVGVGSILVVLLVLYLLGVFGHTATNIR